MVDVNVSMTTRKRRKNVAMRTNGRLPSLPCRSRVRQNIRAARPTATGILWQAVCRICPVVAVLIDRRNNTRLLSIVARQSQEQSGVTHSSSSWTPHTKKRSDTTSATRTRTPNSSRLVTRVIQTKKNPIPNRFFPFPSLPSLKFSCSLRGGNSDSSI
jgi:hypothetical protein